MSSRNKVLLTGASAGIGKAIAFELAGLGYDLILTARRLGRLDILKAELEQKYPVNVKALKLDVSCRKSCEDFFEKNKSDLLNLNILINNAGLAKGVDLIPDARIDDWEAMIDTNVKGVLFVTRLSLPFLSKSKNSYILNIGSVAGKWVYPGGGVYCSTKFAVDAISQGLRMDLHGTGTRVTNICPGLVKTEFSEVRLGNSEKAEAVYKGYKPLDPEDIARTVSWCLQQPPHVNIQELTIFPTDQSAIGMVNK